MATTFVSPYPFDPTGIATTNAIVDEQHPLTVQNYKDYQLVIPRWAPIFRDGLRVRFRNLSGQTRNMDYGLDYYLGYQFQTASLSTAKELYGAIYFLDRTLAGTISIDYQTIGGEWNLDQQQILELLADRAYNPLITSWEQVVDLPVYFPPTDHQWNIYDMVGMSEVNAALGGIEAAIRTSGSGSMDEHIADRNNPHQVTKAQVQLGLVNNYATADSAQTILGTAGNLYTTPLGVRAAINALAITPLDTHINDTDNPHNVTPALIGAPSLTQFQQGLDGKLNVGQSAADTQRFDGKLYAQVVADILAGTAANATTLQGLSVAELTVAILAGTAANSQALEGNSLAQVLTLALQQIEELESLPGTSDNALRFAGRSFAEAQTEILAGTAADSMLLENMSATQLLQEFLDQIALLPQIAASVTDSERFDGKTYQEFIDDFSTIEIGNAALFGGMDPNEWLTQISGATVDNAEHFNLLTPEAYADYVIDHGVTQKGNLATVRFTEPVVTRQYVPIAQGLIDPDAPSTSLPTLVRVTILSMVAGEPILSTYTIGQQDEVVRYYTPSPAPGVLGIGGAPIARAPIDTSDPDYVPGDYDLFDAYGIFLWLEVGTRVVQAEVIQGYPVAALLPAPSASEPADWSLASVDDTLNVAGVSKWILSDTLNAGQSRTYTDLNYDSVFTVLVQDPDTPANWYDAVATFEITRTSTSVILHNATVDDINYRIVVLG